MPFTPTPRAALYARVSTHHGQDVGLQLDALREVASARGWVVVEEFVDEGISGTKTTRPALDAMLEACRIGKVDVIAFWRLDRISRTMAITWIGQRDRLDRAARSPGSGNAITSLSGSSGSGL